MKMEEFISDINGVEEQSGVIPYFYEEGDLKVMIVTSRSGKNWIFPKGYIEDGYSPQDSAAKEAWEEAGIKGQVKKNSIGTYEYYRDGTLHTVEYYAMEINDVLDEWPEMDFRTRFLVNYSEVRDFIEDKELLKMLKSMKKNI